jgi:hypothetical protein
VSTANKVVVRKLFCSGDDNGTLRFSYSVCGAGSVPLRGHGLTCQETNPTTWRFFGPGGSFMSLKDTLYKSRKPPIPFPSKGTQRNGRLATS